MKSWVILDQEISGLLIATDLTKGNCARAVKVWLLDATGLRGNLAVAGSLALVASCLQGASPAVDLQAPVCLDRAMMVLC